MFDCFFSSIKKSTISKFKNVIFGIGVGAWDAKPISPEIIFGIHSFYKSSRVILSRNFLNRIDTNSIISSKKSGLFEFNKLKNIQCLEFLKQRPYKILEDEYKKLII